MGGQKNSRGVTESSMEILYVDTQKTIKEVN